jgi:hypothetical protein
LNYCSDETTGGEEETCRRGLVFAGIGSYCFLSRMG